MNSYTLNNPRNHRKDKDYPIKDEENSESWIDVEGLSGLMREIMWS